MGAHLGLVTEANLSQQLNLAPQLLNWLKLLQVPSVELNQMIQNELLSNPALELDEPDWTDAPEARCDESPELGLGEECYDERLAVLADIDEEWRTADQAPKLASADHLQEQNNYMMDSLVRAANLQEEIDQAIHFSELSEQEVSWMRVLAGSLNARGYLDISLDEFATECGIDADRAWVTLLHFQAIVPPGIGARDLEECLTLQLAAMRVDTCLAERIVRDHLARFAEAEPDQMCELLGVDEHELQLASDQIRMLDPDPGLIYQDVPVEYVQPDLEIFAEEGAVKVELCEESAPPLRISSYCQRLLKAGQAGRADLNFVRKKLREASFIIQGIAQRQETMLKVALQIARVQQEFFLKPNGQLRPLTMNKVAAIIGVHETTVSRAVANKFVRTERGLMEMRAFFKVGYRCADGSSVTPEKIKEQLAALIEAEEPSAPLTDAGLSAIFKKQGVKVARRTVAKYREELGISSSKVRAQKLVC